ncbi:MAG TPA: PP2C family protein-serine/threonine phosphatase, partial [Thermoanaerobaculia bacterium]
MPAGRDWVDLVKSTFRSVRRQDISGLYALEWQRAKSNLTEDHRSEIEKEQRRFKRFLRVTNAVLFGLSRRLAPARRVVFGVVLICVVLAMQGPSIVRDTETTGASVHRTVQYSFYFDNGFLFVALTLSVLLLAMELVDKINYRDELELARALQSSLIPRVLPVVPGFELGAYNRIANMVGGDIYDFVPLSDGRLAVLFGDASGHGMAAGLVMAVAHAAFRTQLDVDPAPGAVFAALNRILCRTGGPRAFFGCVYLLVSPDGGFTGSVGGHPPVLQLDRDGNVVSRFGRGAYPLGIRPALTWDVETGRLLSGQRLFLHSDGLSESRNPAGVEFGETLLESALRRSASAPAPDLVAAIAEEVAGF